jgi:superfamily II DNA or RNA helicase
MTDQERKDIIEWFTNTDGAIISNYGILTTGFDVPNIEVVILYRATKSLPLFLQMAGRGSRISNGKNSFIILDFGNNIKRHNYWEEPRKWTLKKRDKKQGEAPIKECPECSYLMYASIMECPECNYQFEKSEKEKQEEVFAELVLMNGSDIKMMAEKANINELIIIQQAKGYAKSWIYHYLKSKEDFIEYGKLMKYHYKWAINQIKHRKIC